MQDGAAFDVIVICVTVLYALEEFMTLLKARRFWQTGRRYAMLVLICICAFTFTAG